MLRFVRSLGFSLVLAACIPAGAYAQANIQLNPQTSVELQSDPLGAMTKARERVAAGDLEGAIVGLQSYMINHPGEVGPERLLGDLFYRRTDLRRAEATYQHILSYDPTDKETHNRLGSVYATENRLDDAIAEFNRSLPGTDSVPDLVHLHERKGDLAVYKHQLEATAEQYATDPEAQLEVAEAYETEGEPEIAARFFKRALDNDPNSVIALNGLGLAYMDEHLYTQAIRQFGTCLGHDGYNYACMDNLGATYLHMGQWTQADSVLQNAHKIQPERPEALVNLGYLLDVRGDWKRAVVMYIDAMTVYPYSPEAYINLGSTYNEHAMYQLALAALIKGLAIAPNDGSLHFLLGEVYSHQGNNALAAEQYRAAAVGSDLDPGYRRAAQERIATLAAPAPTSTP